MARQLARVKADIHGNVTMCTFAITGQLAITVEYRTVTAHLLQLHQDAGKLDMPYNSHARSGVNSEIAMSATGSEVPYAPISGITELIFSKLEATTQNISWGNLAKGGLKVLNLQKYACFFQ
ncbi:uncharacterized protein LOC112903257 [Panicum hallii]|uniref:uncharacterized protein LOC112903257 n=1 Tax=Panicum hallii TaxID=206008 RepID=UPI000DF4E65B|nr:uncharacterized protein LOC112903257 [Panicum hallii]